MRFLKSLLFPGRFMLHGNGNLCIQGPIGLHGLWDSLIALCYQMMPIALAHHSYNYREPATCRTSRLLVTQQLSRHALTICTEKSA
jgi:hypothetical protein